ncbi:MAG: tetratricopeptide (TPR) repeat protein, partial [Bacteroidia bacterium]
MKRIITHVFTLFLFCLVSSSVFAQDDPYARFVNNGLKLSRMQQYSAAIKEFDLATSISDTSARIYYYKGLCYFSMRDAKKAIKPFEEAVERNPKYLDALSKLLICYKKEEDLTNTINTYDRLAVAVKDKKKKLSAKKSVVYILLSEDSFDSAHLYIDQ